MRRPASARVPVGGGEVPVGWTPLRSLERRTPAVWRAPRREVLVPTRKESDVRATDHIGLLGRRRPRVSSEAPRRISRRGKGVVQEQDPVALRHDLISDPLGGWELYEAGRNGWGKYDRITGRTARLLRLDLVRPHARWRVSPACHRPPVRAARAGRRVRACGRRVVRRARLPGRRRSASASADPDHLARAAA